MDVSARDADARDLEHLAELYAGAVEELRPLRGGDLWARREAREQPYRSSIASSLADDGVAVVVGTIDDTTVGFAIASPVVLHDGELIADLTELYVVPGARGVGVGEAMMNLIFEWCRARGCAGIDSTALPGDRATKNFFESWGLVARALRVHRRL